MGFETETLKKSKGGEQLVRPTSMIVVCNALKRAGSWEQMSLFNIFTFNKLRVLKKSFPPTVSTHDRRLSSSTSWGNPKRGRGGTNDPIYRKRPEFLSITHKLHSDHDAQFYVGES